MTPTLVISSRVVRSFGVAIAAHAVHAVLAGCSAAPLARPRAVLEPVAELASTPTLLAAIARADITPPVGLSLAGHGPEGRVAAGTRLRLGCTAFVLQQGRELVALVPCELGWISTALHEAVIARTRAQGVALAPRQLLLSATHTHAGPAHFFEEANYSGAFSSREPGYDPRVRDFLAARIAGAIVAAFRARAPARASWNTVTVRGVAFNQSMEGFLANRTLPSRLRARFERVTEPEGAGSERLSESERALDPTLSLLRLDRVGPNGRAGGVLGAFVVFGVHPTAVPNTNDLYHGDVFGFAQREAERALNAGGGTALIGLSNGIEGDVVAAAHPPGFPEARRLGGVLARHITHALRTAPAGSDSIALRAERLELDLVRHVARVGGAESARAESRETLALCCDPALGAPSGGGANDGPTRFRMVPALNEGERDPEGAGCHGHKLLLQLGDAFVPGRDFPSLAPLMLIRVGRGWIASAPAELTTVTGERIRASVERVLGEMASPDDRAAPIAVVGMANSYLQYVATRDEYDLQRYEGASTLYGAGTEAFLREYFACMARSYRDGTPCVPIERVAPRCAQLPEDPEPEMAERLAARPAADPQHARALAVTTSAENGERGVQFAWEGHWSPDRAPEVHSVRIERADGSLVDDDRGASIETRYYGSSAAGPSWSARWIPDLATGDIRCSASYRFVVTNERGARLVSSLFRPPCATPEDP